MDKSRTIHILGAGLSGLSAAVNLAREGRDVRVLEKEARIGGSPRFHPSLHVTPACLDDLCGAVGIDVRRAFRPVSLLRSFIRTHKFDIDPTDLYIVERGSRPESIDTILYQEALKAGVGFEFGRELRDPDELPPGSIIATGLAPNMYERLDIPTIGIYGYAAYTTTDLEGVASSYFDDFCSEYLYSAASRGLWYSLIFSRDPVEADGQEKGRRLIMEREGLNLSEWALLKARVPLREIPAPGPIHSDKILAGTLSGAMDPFFLFGIVGALLSGRIAARAVSDRPGAVKAFHRVNRLHNFTFFSRKFYDRIPWKLSLYRLLFQHPRLFAPAIMTIDQGIPGYRRHYILRLLAGQS